ncbi:hypothetical protein ACFU6S_15790 [Streptomyces sp. NPDC057456]|uniref:hypothetical protein n=1 Tax=Streptomyces sp. NPDC057456 TaxID=3346139 RepID=UPI0036C614D8
MARRLLTGTGATAPELVAVGTVAAVVEVVVVAEGGPGVDVGDGPRCVPPGRGAVGPLPAERVPLPPGAPPGEEDGVVRGGTARCTL